MTEKRRDEIPNPLYKALMRPKDPKIREAIERKRNGKE